MATTEDKIAQYLNEAHALELALVRTLQAHIAMTPTGEYRSALERHLSQTKEHADRIRRRLADLGHAPGLAELGYGIAQRVISQLLSLGKAPLDVVRGGSAEEKLLKNVKDECASEALEIATYDALEELALQAGDARTARLATEQRADEERMLAELRSLLPALTAAVVGAEVRGEPTCDVSRSGAAQEREEHRHPFPGYDELTVARVVRRLDGLTPAERRHVATYERAHKDRRGVLDAVAHLQEREEAQPVG